jgi:hypothetical protein
VSHLRSQHVDKSVAHIALVLEVNGQVEEVKGALELLFNGLHDKDTVQQHTKAPTQQEFKFPACLF